ncbi:hypothetical protein O181_107473 [Austropuccinia psidii MF-1]|uniref:Uncharacterized protein n=1 Tax=Austropuccinia psidii MF-1 TaxID=1389203 RepID=A0A9Q3JQY2_9BASI|nr:hypothetical protein [Austropuccinia psidii MF-1]
MANAIREHYDDDQDPKGEFLVEYQEETQLETWDIQLEAGMPQDTTNKNLCTNTQDSQTFLVTPSTGMENIHWKATKMTGKYLDNHYPNWKKELFPNKAKNFKSASGKMTSIGTIIKEIIIPHGKCNIDLNPELIVLEFAHIQEFLLGTYYQSMCGIDIYNSKNSHITIGTKKKRNFHLICTRCQTKTL